MRIVKWLTLKLSIITDNDVEDFYIEDIVQLALEEECKVLLKQLGDVPLRYVRISTELSKKDVIVNDDYSLPET